MAADLAGSRTGSNHVPDLLARLEFGHAFELHDVRNPGISIRPDVQALGAPRMAEEPGNHRVRGDHGVERGGDPAYRLASTVRRLSSNLRCLREVMQTPAAAAVFQEADENVLESELQASSSPSLRWAIVRHPPPDAVTADHVAKTITTFPRDHITRTITPERPERDAQKDSS